MDIIEVKFNFRGNPLFEQIESFKNSSDEFKRLN